MCAAENHGRIRRPKFLKAHDLRCLALIVTAAVGVLLAVCGVYRRPTPLNSEVLRASYAIPDGGDYCSLDDTGVANDINHAGVRILVASRSHNYFGEGFTFTVALNVARSKDLLDGLNVARLQRAQREWYGAVGASGPKQLVAALAHLDMGGEVNPSDAKPGDFVIFSRRNTTHSAVFLGWVMYEGKRVGIRYRSAQKQTRGVGDAAEYFTTSGFPSGSIVPETVVFAQMTRP